MRSSSAASRAASWPVQPACMTVSLPCCEQSTICALQVIKASTAQQTGRDSESDSDRCHTAVLRSTSARSATACQQDKFLERRPTPYLVQLHCAALMSSSGASGARAAHSTRTLQLALVMGAGQHQLPATVARPCSCYSWLCLYPEPQGGACSLPKSALAAALGYWQDVTPSECPRPCSSTRAQARLRQIMWARLQGS